MIPQKVTFARSIPELSAFSSSRYVCRIYRIEGDNTTRCASVFAFSPEGAGKLADEKISQLRARLIESGQLQSRKYVRFETEAARQNFCVARTPGHEYLADIIGIAPDGARHVISTEHGANSRIAEARAVYRALRMSFEHHPEKPVFGIGEVVGPIVGLGGRYQCRIFKHMKGTDPIPNREVVDVIEGDTSVGVRSAALLKAQEFRDAHRKSLAFENTTDTEALRSSIENAHRELDNSGLIGRREHTHQGLTNRVKAVISIAKSRIGR